MEDTQEAEEVLALQSGGKGGRENSTCGPPEDGGLGGRQVFNTVLEGNLLLGGGGGSSTSASRQQCFTRRKGRWNYNYCM